ncbi:hypothetical protein H4S01_005888, partial [Coemansia sp. RSA 2610]
MEAKLEEPADADSGFDTAAKRQKIESLIREHEQDVEATKELSVDSLVECLLARIKKRSQVVAEELDLPSLSPELQELNASKCAQRVLGAQQAVNFVKEQLTDLEDVLTGDKRRNSKRQAAREEQKQTSKPEPTPIDAGNELAASFSGGSDDYESTSDLDADPATRLSRPASKFVGSLDQGFSDVSMSDDNDDDNDDDSDDGNGKCGQRQLVGSKQRKRTRNPDEYDEQADKEFMALYHGSDTVRPKNRPGQRQRRRQYEREYGQEANHIKIWQKEKKPRNDFKSQRQPHSASAKPAKDTRPNAKDQKLHPSWEAKRREKELLEQAKSIKGQKINFPVNILKNLRVKDIKPIILYHNALSPNNVRNPNGHKSSLVEDLRQCLITAHIQRNRDLYEKLVGYIGLVSRRPNSHLFTRFSEYAWHDSHYYPIPTTGPWEEHDRVHNGSVANAARFRETIGVPSAVPGGLVNAQYLSSPAAPYQLPAAALPVVTPTELANIAFNEYGLLFPKENIAAPFTCPASPSRMHSKAVMTKLTEDQLDLLRANADDSEKE